MPNINIHKAIAGGEQNNCLLNCIAHSLFSLPEKQLKRISQRQSFDI